MEIKRKRTNLEITERSTLPEKQQKKLANMDSSERPYDKARVWNVIRITRIFRRDFQELKTRSEILLSGESSKDNYETVIRDIAIFIDALRKASRDIVNAKEDMRHTKDRIKNAQILKKIRQYLTGKNSNGGLISATTEYSTRLKFMLRKR